MARTTAANVRLIMSTSLTDAQLAAFIETAHQIVTNEIEDSSVTSTKLELIERWLAAHFASVRTKQTASEKAGSVSATFQGQTAMHLEATHYGQNAMLLDDSGALAALNKMKEESVSMSNLWKEPSTW